MEEKNSPSSKDLKIEGGDENHPAESGSTGNVSDQVIVLQSPKTALMLLPEIWEQTFRRLTPTDFMRVSGLCPEWYQLLKPYKAKKLVSQVLELGVEGGISREVLLKFRDLNEESRIAAEDALHRDNVRILDRNMEMHQQLQMVAQRMQEENLQLEIENQRIREENLQLGMELQRIRENQQQP